MKIGDLVRYCDIDDEIRNPKDELGIVTKTGTYTNGKPECHVVWFTCDNEGWWNSENLEVISELSSR
jgi:hypothetical protein